MAKQSKKTMSEMIDASKLKKDLNKTSKTKIGATKNKVGRPRKSEREKLKQVVIRMSPILLEELDEYLLTRRINNRSSWINQLISEKILSDK